MHAKISIDVLLEPRIPRLEGKNKRTSGAEALKQLDVSYFTVINWVSIPFQEIIKRYTCRILTLLYDTGGAGFEDYEMGSSKHPVSYEELSTFSTEWLNLAI